MSYGVVAILGAGIFSLYWFGVTRVFRRNQVILPQEIEEQPAREVQRRQALLNKLRQEYILSHDNLSPALLAGLEEPPASWINERLKELGEVWTVSEPPNKQRGHEEEQRAIPAPPITKVDKFAVVVPFDAAHKNLPIPMNENFNDPKKRFYQDLLSLSGRPDKPPEGEHYVDRDFSTEAGRAQFIGRLLQNYVFRSVDELQRDSEGIEWTAEKGSRPVVRVGIVAPDRAPYPREALFATLSKSEFLRPFDRITWNENRPVMMPKHTVIHLVEQPSSPKTGVAAYVVRFERPKYFSLEFKMTQTLGPVTVTGVPGASLPTGFQTKVNGVVGYPFIVTMHYRIERPNDREFRPEDYAKWGDALFSGLRQRLAFDSSGD